MIMNTFEEERSKGVTIETGFSTIKAHDREIVLMDTPGHQSFIQSMI